MTGTAGLTNDTRETSHSAATPEPDAGSCKRGHAASERVRDKRGHLYCRSCRREDVANLRGRRSGVRNPKPGATTAKPKAQRYQTDYRKGLNGMLQLASFPLVMLGTQKPEFLADAAAIGEHGPGVVDAVNDLAQDDPRLAAVLDKILGMGPYGALIAATLPLVAQLLANHKILPLPVLQGMGAKDPDALIAKLVREMEAQARAEAEELAYMAARARSAGDNGEAV
jgi:hypothetical protein